jgi:hypothetical protein
MCESGIGADDGKGRLGTCGEWRDIVECEESGGGLKMAE